MCKHFNEEMALAQTSSRLEVGGIHDISVALTQAAGCALVSAVGTIWRGRQPDRPWNGMIWCPWGGLRLPRLLRVARKNNKSLSIWHPYLGQRLRIEHLVGADDPIEVEDVGRHGVDLVAR